MIEEEFNSLEWRKVAGDNLNNLINGYTITGVETRTDFFTSEGEPVPGAVIIYLSGNEGKKAVIIGASDECYDPDGEELIEISVAEY